MTPETREAAALALARVYYGTTAIDKLADLSPAHQEMYLAQVDAVAPLLEGPLQEELNGVYTERNNVVLALAMLARALGWKVGVMADQACPPWGILYIDGPTGQLSWHFHSEREPWFDEFPPYDGTWDGHTNDQKYQRLGRAGGAAWGARWQQELRDALGPVRGMWECDKCHFVWQKNILNPDTGAVGAPAVTELPTCPNDGEPMRSRTWRDLCMDARVCVEALRQERDEAKAALDANWVTHQRVVAAEAQHLAALQQREAEVTARVKRETKERVVAGLKAKREAVPVGATAEAFGSLDVPLYNLYSWAIAAIEGEDE